MGMVHIWLLGISACLISASCLAEDLPAEDQPDVIRARVASVVKAHAGTIGCVVAVNPRHVIPYTLEGGRVYVALYHADVGCSGGTSMGRPVLVIVRHAAYDSYVVDARYSTPQQSPDDLPSTITTLAAHDGRIEFKGLALEPSDALCCPSRRVQGYLRLTTGVTPKWDLER